MKLERLNSVTLAAIVALSACSRLDSSRERDSTGLKLPTDTSAARANAKRSMPDIETTVTETGYGPLLIGMTVANAATALNSPIPSTAGLDTACAYIHVANMPAGMRIMFTGGTVARIEVDSNTIATGLGARVGDSELRVRGLYGPRVTAEPHKYLPGGHYLIVAPIPPTDSALRLVFETDGKRVTKYRAGRMPQVKWVEGCA